MRSLFHPEDYRHAPPAGPAVRAPGSELDRWLGTRGLHGWFAQRLLAWRELRDAARASRELLATYRRIVARFPGLGDREHYRILIMSRTGCDASTADGILEDASESFAQWPVRRDITLCDVVHYLSVAEFLAAHSGEHWMHADIRHVVADCIPEDLCTERSREHATTAAPR